MKLDRVINIPNFISIVMISFGAIGFLNTSTLLQNGLNAQATVINRIVAGGGKRHRPPRIVLEFKDANNKNRRVKKYITNPILNKLDPGDSLEIIYEAGNIENLTPKEWIKIQVLWNYIFLVSGIVLIIVTAKGH